MDSHSDEIVHVVSLSKFKDEKKYKDEIVSSILAAICAMLNSYGGRVVICFETSNNNNPVEDPSSQLLIRILEQSMIAIIGMHMIRSNIIFKEEEDAECITISVTRADLLTTTKYNFCSPSHTQVVEESPLTPVKEIKDNIFNRKKVEKPVLPDTHRRNFSKNKKCGFHESTTRQFKNLKAAEEKRTKLGDRMVGKGNKFTCYVSAFANYNGGHIYYGIADDTRLVEGEFIANEKRKNEITKKVEKAINKMIWPEQKPKRGEHWEIIFEPVVDENAKPVPSTFVIVIYIAPCLGGVFTEEPECYEMVEGKVQKMSFATWKERILEPVLLQRLPGKEKIHNSMPLITWSSDAVRKAFTIGCDELRKIISNGSWEILEKECNSLQNEPDLRETMKLLVLFKQITACNRRGEFEDADKLLTEYRLLFAKVQDSFIFDVLGLYLEAALKRARGDFKGLTKPLKEALSKAELIEPGLVTATVYVFAATVSDLKNLNSDLESPAVLTERALEHLECVPDSSDVLAAMRRKANIILAAFHLGCNASGQLLMDSITILGLKKAETCIKAIYKSSYKNHPLSVYYDIQLNFVLSIFKYRHSQLVPDRTNRDLCDAWSYTRKAQSLADKYGFTEMVEWSKNNEALCLEELNRTKTPVPKHENDGRACGSDVTHKAKSQGRNAMSLNSDHPNIEGNSQRNVRPLEHFECVLDSSNDVADKKRKENITSASYHLGINICGQQIHDSIDISSLKEAQTHIKAIYKSGYKDHPLSVYCDIQLNLVLSMFKYRHSQLYPDKSNSYLHDARSFIRKAQRLAGKYGFTKLIECSKKIEEELDRAKTPVQNHGNDDRPHSTSSPRHVTQNVESQDTSAKSQSSDDPNVEEKSQQTRAVDEEVPPAPSNVPTSNTEQEPEAENSGDKQAQLQSDRVSPSGPQKQSIDMSKFLSAKPFQPRTTSSSGSANQIPPNVSVTTKRPEIPMHDARGATALERNVSLGGQTGAPSFVGQVLYQGPPAMASFPVDVQVQHSPPLFLFAGYNYRSLVPNYPVDTSLPCQPWVGTQPDPAFSHFPLHPQPQHQQQVGDFQSSRFPAYDNTNEHRRQNTQCRQSRRDRS